MNQSKNFLQFIILGAGPTGLGAARQLEQIGSCQWVLLEASTDPGGLSTSCVDQEGFTWDIGGHVQFSHYDYFDKAMHEFLGTDGWYHHQRESWVWIRERFVPYPFQNNIHRLPPDDLNRCLQGLLEVARDPHPKPSNFQEWIDASFGRGLAEIFMEPYNFKVWAYTPELMNAVWVGERVAETDLGRILKNLVYRTDDLSWGPNNTFQFPKRGGTGAIWCACAAQLPKDKLHFSTRVSRIDMKSKQVHTNDGRSYGYEHLISTVPLRELIMLTGQAQLKTLVDRCLLYSSCNIFGLGLKGKPRKELATKCWMYFPENNCPFYRVTVFSNYSPNNVPNINKHWSLLCEVSESPYKPVNQNTLLEEVIQGALNTKLIAQRTDIVSTWQYRAEYGYPTPSLHRDKALTEIIPFFEHQDVYSRGRFGMWKYEVGNQDHSFMQGVEIVERLLNNRKEITVFDANHVNTKKHPWPFESWQNKEKDKA